MPGILIRWRDASFGMFARRTNWPLNPNRLSLAVVERRSCGLPILDLTESNPTVCGFDLDRRTVLSALAGEEILRYEPDPRGLLSARRAVVGYYAERGVQLSPEQIFLTTGTSEAYSYIFRLIANAGDHVLAPQPSYPLFDYLAALNDVEVAGYPLYYGQAWHLDIATLEARITPGSRAILVVHPNNPTGSFVRASELERLAECCRTGGLSLVADEVFADYALGANERHIGSHAGFAEVLTFTLSGLSKISALPQIKLAWIAVNGPPATLAQALDRLEIIADTYLSVSTPLAAALPQLLELRHSIQPQIVSRLQGNVEILDQTLGAHSPATRLAIEGGWYAILRLPSVRSDEDWAIELVKEEGVLVHPGHFYDFPTGSYLVVSLLPQPEIFSEGVSRIMRVMERTAT